jgi:hypothetical protein
VKVLNACFTDSGAAAYSLSHALNKVPGISSINLRTSNSFVNYPTLAEVRYYGEENCKRMIEDSDIIVFQTSVRPFFSALHLDPEKIKKKKLMLYFQGSEARHLGAQIIEDAGKLMGHYQLLVSTPDLLPGCNEALEKVFPGEGRKAIWLPVARDFQQLKAQFGMAPRDRKALKQWKGVARKTVICHAPTNLEIKGSAQFYPVITELVETLQEVEFLSIKDVPWDTCMRLLSTIDILYDQCVLGGYGMISVEASIWGTSIFCKLLPEVITVMQKESGVPQPFIQWETPDDLRTQSFMLAQEPKLRKKFGTLAWNYCWTMHDDLNVAERFLKIADQM